MTYQFASWNSMVVSILVDSTQKMLNWGSANMIRLSCIHDYNEKVRISCLHRCQCTYYPAFLAANLTLWLYVRHTSGATESSQSSALKRHEAYDFTRLRLIRAGIFGSRYPILNSINYYDRALFTNALGAMGVVTSVILGTIGASALAAIGRKVFKQQVKSKDDTPVKRGTQRRREQQASQRIERKRGTASDTGY